MREIRFTASAFEQYNVLIQANPHLRERIKKLIDECLRTPFVGTGKPEPLKYEFKGCWSRRINDEHRLVYQVTNDAITIISCAFHYSK